MTPLYERLAVCLYMTDAAHLPSHSNMVERLFAASKEWFSVPDNVMRLDYSTDTGKQEKVNWGDGRNLVDEPLGATQLLFVYAAHDAERYTEEETPPLVSINEAKNRIVYRISVPFTILVPHELRFIEQWILRLYEMMMDCGECLLAAGSETDIFADKPLEETVEVILSSTLSASWVGLPLSLWDRNLTNAEEPACQTSEFVVFRRHDPFAWCREKHGASDVA